MKPSWKQKIKSSITDIKQIKEIDSTLLRDKVISNSKFGIKAPLHFVSKVESWDTSDPILRQFLPLSDENIESNGYSQDPNLESKFTKIPGLIHKYKSRVLLIITGACAINCRYCFRREYPYTKNIVSKKNIDKIIEYINSDLNIDEVILSGGDPLIATNEHLDFVLERLSNIRHLKTLRIHTRIPVVLPSRITSELIATLNKSRLKKVIVLHTNHPAEIDNKVSDACNKLIDAKYILLNQSVLLNGVNDNARTLKELNEKLFNINVIPYYLHMLDKIKGASHFEVSLNKAQQIYKELQALTSGYLVPKLVTETPNSQSKTLIY